MLEVNKELMKPCFEAMDKVFEEEKHKPHQMMDIFNSVFLEEVNSMREDIIKCQE